MFTRGPDAIVIDLCAELDRTHLTAATAERYVAALAQAGHLVPAKLAFRTERPAYRLGRETEAAMIDYLAAEIARHRPAAGEMQYPAPQPVRWMS